MKRNILIFTIISLFTILLIGIMQSNVFATDNMSSEFKSYLNEDGKLIFKSIRTEDRDMFHFIFEDLFQMDGKGNYIESGISYDNLSKDMNYLDFTINYGKKNEETHRVEIVYTYDENIKKMIDEYTNKIPKDLEYFQVKDMEVVNFWLNGNNLCENLTSYSGELKKYLNYKNFNLNFKMGSCSEFSIYASGIAFFKYDGTIYKTRGNTGVNANYIIYVDEKTGETKEELVSTVQKRIDNYIGKGKVKVSYVGTGIFDFLTKESFEGKEKEEENLKLKIEERNKINKKIQQLKDNGEEYYELEWQRDDIESEIERLEDSIKGFEDAIKWAEENYKSKNGEFYFLNGAIGDYYFKAELSDGQTYYFIVKKDSKNMIRPETKTSDVSTDITISCSSSNIPLDTTIKVSKLTNGSEYQKIIKTLNVNNNATFDIGLYSNSLEDNIKKLSDGSFEVKIPVPENLKNKILTIYYVDVNNKIEEHEVTIKDGYAVFTTNHFSIYTLAEKDGDVEDIITDRVLDDEPKAGEIDYTIFANTITLISLGGIVLVNLKK